ncbi:hypothetical protein OE88DRAFT_1643530 [Heliocybe sulcata]|uniref:Uncharacterized protein n=1 Tax=Heliocybe sulcata TaxID=5364 RepID=A0A5C3N7H5_9AGAM|nr:hypothetical protein OE88DRAFT_1643530 [Heliocybe sulcata]
MGEYAEDLPHGLLEPKEMEEAVEFLARPPGEEDPEVPNFYHFMHSWCADWRLPSRDYDFYISLARLERRVFMLLAYPGQLESIYYHHPHAYVHETRLVLLNTSKKEYVWASAVSDAVGDAINLGDVLFSQICWSTDRTTSLHYRGDIHRGVWAGDCFAIKTAEESEVGGNTSTRTDISERVVKEVVAVWRSEYGPKWPTTISEVAESDPEEYSSGEESDSDDEGSYSEGEESEGDELQDDEFDSGGEESAEKNQEAYVEDK